MCIRDRILAYLTAFWNVHVSGNTQIFAVWATAWRGNISDFLSSKQSPLYIIQRNVLQWAGVRLGVSPRSFLQNNKNTGPWEEHTIVHSACDLPLKTQWSFKFIFLSSPLLLLSLIGLPAFKVYSLHPLSYSPIALSELLWCCHNNKTKSRQRRIISLCYIVFGKKKTNTNHSLPPPLIF